MGTKTHRSNAYCFNNRLNRIDGDGLSVLASDSVYGWVVEPIVDHPNG